MRRPRSRRLVVAAADAARRMGLGSAVQRAARVRRRLRGRSRLRDRSNALATSSYTARELVDRVASLGVGVGDVLLVHSSMNGLTGYTDDAETLIRALLELVGESGTLLMPAHPRYVGDSTSFRVSRTPAVTGLVAETFRRWPGVIRSAHPTHSVCALGASAQVLTEAHHLDGHGCGPQSPYARLPALGGKILALGLTVAYTTFLHVVEDEDIERFPVEIYDSTKRFSVEHDESFSLDVPIRSERVLARMDLEGLDRRLDDRIRRSEVFRGATIWVAGAEPLLVRLRQLRDQGITLYG